MINRKKYDKKYRETHKKEKIEEKRRYYQKYAEKIYQKRKQYKKENPEKIKTQQKVYYARKTGKIKKTSCIFCGEKKVIAHHPNYSKPLEVMWVCKSCHYKLHKKLREKRGSKME